VASSRRQFALRIWVDAGKYLPVPEFHFIPPCNPVAAKAVPTVDRRQHEVKFNGYRVQALKIGSRVVVFSRICADPALAMCSRRWRGE